jgi:hypothetical protein
MYASAQPLDFLASTKIFRLKAVSGMTRLSLLFESETDSVPSGVSGWTLAYTCTNALHDCGMEESPQSASEGKSI